MKFSNAISTNDFDQWVHFYEYDYEFEKLWTNPRKYLSHLSKFNGVITPDFSLYRDMPLVMQAWNTYRGKALGHWWQSHSLNVISNIRWGDERTYDFCCAGVPRNSVIAVGSYGCMKILRERKFFAEGLEYAIKTLTPKVIVVYGSAPDCMFAQYKKIGVEIVQFEADYWRLQGKEMKA